MLLSIYLAIRLSTNVPGIGTSTINSISAWHGHLQMPTLYFHGHSTK
ncbi:11280_t:CDS:1, partial [Dentiscutata erythropus]